MAEFWVDPNAAGGANSGTGTEGDPYGSLNRFFLQQLANFNAADEDFIVNVIAGADAADMEGDWTIDATSSAERSLIIRALGANRHTGVRDTGYRYAGASGRFRVINNNANVTVRLEGLVSSGGQRIQASGSGPTVWDAVAAFDAAGTWGLFHDGPGNLVGYNCLSVGNDGYGFQLEDGTATFYNSTFAANGIGGTSRLGGSLTLVNCYSGGNTGEDYGGATTFTSCYSEDGSQSTPTAAFSTSTFENVTAGNENMKLVSGSALIGAGVGPSVDGDVPTRDFEGDERSGATTDVGFDQFVSGEAIEGELSSVLGSLSVEAAGSVDIAGSGDVTLDDATLDASSEIEIAGSLEQTLDSLAAEGSGSVAIEGSGDAQLGETESASQGSVDITGTADVTLDDLESVSTPAEIPAISQIAFGPLQYRSIAFRLRARSITFELRGHS